MKKATWTALLALPLFLAACGGGGIDSGDAANQAQMEVAVTGFWRGTLAVDTTANQCALASTTSTDYGVSMKAGVVTLRGPEGLTLTGGMVSSTGFDVQGQYIGQTDSSFRVIFSNINNGVANAELRYIQKSPTACTTIWRGELRRS